MSCVRDKILPKFGNVVYIPTSYDNLSTRKLPTIELVEGVPIKAKLREVRSD